MRERYEWLARRLGAATLNDGQRRCIDTLCQGIEAHYNLHVVGRNQPSGGFEWNGHGLLVRLRTPLSTWDTDTLTRLVLAAHRNAVRVEISPHSHAGMKVYLTPREREGDLYTRHPNLFDLTYALHDELDL